MPTSSEFIDLCRAQVAVLTQGLGASLSVVYLTQRLAEGAEPRLIPVVAYPESVANWDSDASWLPFLAEGNVAEMNPRLLTEATIEGANIDALGSESALGDGTRHRFQEDRKLSKPSDHEQIEPEANFIAAQRQLVVPLMHEDVVLGLLVVGRDDRAWSEWEQEQIEHVATTLAIACVLDQRYQWLERDRQQQQLLQAEQHDLLDNLLHQFRNSLTALQTFGKLILKRLLPGDANREIASSILREAERLRDLSQQLESAAGTGIVPKAPLSLPAALGGWQSDQLEASIELGSHPSAGFLASSTLALEPCSVATILEPLLASAKAIAQDQNLSLDSSYPNDLPPVLANPQALREVLNNLMENALKYTPAGGGIEVAVFVDGKEDEDEKEDADGKEDEDTGDKENRRDAQLKIQNFSSPAVSKSYGDAKSFRQTSPFSYVGGFTPCLNAEGSTEFKIPSLSISISDTGPGIPPEDQLHLFERHYRGRQANSDIPGTGLGLAIAKTLMEQMHGEIQVISPAQIHIHPPETLAGATNIAPGTTFVVRLPISQED